MTATDQDYAAAARELGGAARVVIATHENPDGDAIGSLIGALRGLRSAGIDAAALSGRPPLPREYGWLDRGEITREPPEPGYVLLAVDCGSGARVAPHEALDHATVVLNIDHHHDNTRFGAVNVVDAAAACTAMMIYQLLEKMRVPVDGSTAEPLYVGLVTDTGRFQYSNTDARAMRFAATMIDLGVEPQAVFARVYEHVQAAKLRLLGRALQRVEDRLDGLLAVTWVTSEDVAESGADETATDGIVDYLRAIEGVEVAAFVRSATNGARWKVSLRANSDRVDVSRIARSGGGGGHTRAAGFASNLALDELVAFIEHQVTRG